MAAQRAAPIIVVADSSRPDFPMAKLQDSPGGVPAPAGAAAAIEFVLAAERDAVADVERCRSRCAARLDEARIEARRLVERAESIAQAIHARTERVATQRAGAVVQASAPCAAAAAELDAIVARIAAQLTEPGDD
jgi:vacuolar-type H+-ATPase subunit H